MIAGLASLDHPLAQGARAHRVADAFLAIAEPTSPGETTRDGVAVHGQAGDRYALAARWCAAGPFLPVSWREAIDVDALLRLGPDMTRSIRDAIAATAGQVELAFQFDDPPRHAAQASILAAPLSGRDYLRARCGAARASEAFLSRLRATAAEAHVTLSLLAVTGKGASGLMRCARSEVPAMRRMLETVAAAFPPAPFAVTHPLPLFGAGAELVSRLGLGRVRSAA